MSCKCIKIDYSLLVPATTCDTISITYTLVGEEPETVEVDFVDGEYRVNDFLFGTDLIISPSETGWNVVYSFQIQATLTEVNCPFGAFTIPLESMFETFRVDPIMIPNPLIRCYQLEVWNKQCEYSKCVLEYVNNLIFGIDVCKLEESLKEQRRILEILNSYDPRDILGNTTNYNTITYTKIKQLLHLHLLCHLIVDLPHLHLLYSFYLNFNFLQQHSTPL